MEPSTEAPRDHVSRVKAASPFGTTVFVGLRSLDVFLQHGLLAKGWGALAISKIGGSAVSFGAAPTVALGLPLWPLTIVGMAAGLTIKQIHVLLALSEQEMPAKLSLIVGAANTINNGVNGLLFCSSLFSAYQPINSISEAPPVFIAGVSLYTIGFALEWLSEIQRAGFKANPENKGKPYTEGLFSLARHINYGGYSIMRAGYAMVTGGWVWGLMTGAIMLFNFASGPVPALDSYCSKRVSFGDPFSGCFGGLADSWIVRHGMDSIQEEDNHQDGSTDILMTGVG